MLMSVFTDSVTPALSPYKMRSARSSTSGSEVGAALAVYVGGDAVVDLWGGHADAARTRPWERDTIVNLYSVGKAVAAICALRLVRRGALDLDAPVARYWPSSPRRARRGPGAPSLTHQAALPAIARALPSGAWSHWEVMTEALAAQAPGGSRARATAITSTRRGS